jgi:hypothetical protein
MKRVACLIVGIVLTACQAFAANGDLIVDGSLGVGTATPGAKLDVNGTVKIQNSSAIGAARVNGGATPEYPYYFELTVDGDPNTFYPVAMMYASNGGVPGKFVISRVFTDPGPKGVAGQPTTQHIGGLMAVFSTMNSCWSDYCYLNLEKYRFTYVRTIADCTNLSAESNGRSVIVRLRGGGFRYRFYANYNLSPMVVTPGAVAYSSGTYTFYYPDTIDLASLPNNAFAVGTDTPVDKNGNLGIGTIAPQAKLQVLGTLLVGNENGTAPYRVSLGSSGGDYGSVGYNFKPSTTSGSYKYLANDTSSRIEFKSGGFIFKTAGSGTTGSNITFSDAMVVNANGNVVVNGTVTASNGLLGPSDAIFKKNLLPIKDPVGTVNNLRGVSYEWKTDEFSERNFSSGRHYGVIAQEIEKVLPEVVNTAPDGTKAVAYTEIIPVLIEAIKEQQLLLEKQKGEIAEIRQLLQEKN